MKAPYNTLENLFTPFRENVNSIPLPSKFTFPFYYQPHTLCKIAAKQLQDHMRSQNDWEWDFDNEKQLDGICMGKMFGVLVVENNAGELGFLSAFSGKLADSNHLPGFVPPVYDMLTEDGFFLKEMDVLNVLNAKIKTLKNSQNWIDSNIHLQQTKANKAKALHDFKEKMRLEKAERKKQRTQAKTKLSAESYTELEQKLIQESLRNKRELKALNAYWQEQEFQASEQQTALQNQLENYKKERKAKSGILQQRLFEEYTFLNARNETKNLIEIFEGTVQKQPPAAAGECCAPKLLQYAYVHKLKPIAMAEFWWGQSPQAEVRQQGNFYPACRGKCEPILGHMLQGLSLDENPMLQSPALRREIEIIYQDSSLAVINKPEEFLSVPGKNSSDSVLEQMQKLFPNATGPLVVHRLDMSTSGIMLIAKTEFAHKHLQAQFIKRKIKKHYIALLSGVVKANEGTIDLPLRVDLNDRPRQVVCYEHGKAARTHWKVIERTNNQTRVQFFPVTGRTHQLRVHAAHTQGLNTPIVGDDLYGTKANRLHLHAQSISFEHPNTNKWISFCAEADF